MKAPYQAVVCHLALKNQSRCNVRIEGVVLRNSSARQSALTTVSRALNTARGPISLTAPFPWYHTGQPREYLGRDTSSQAGHTFSELPVIPRVALRLSTTSCARSTTHA